MNIHYFNNCASTRVDDEMMEIINQYNTQYYYNPGTLGGNSAVVNKQMQDSRLLLANTIGADKQEIVFTSGGTESNNIAILGTTKGKKGNAIITMCEHSSAYYTTLSLEDKGIEVRIAKCDGEGHIDYEHYLSLVDDNTVLAVMMHANNETGALNDIKYLAHAVKAINSKTIVFSDGVQAVGKVAVNVKNLGVDLYSMSGHKLHTTKGIGALYVKKGTKISSLVYGGGHEGGIRSGTEFVPGIITMGKAVSNAVANIDRLEPIYVSYRQQVIDCVHCIGGEYITCKTNYLPCVISLALEGIKSEVLVNMLEMDGVMIGTSSGCSAKTSKAGRVYTHIGMADKYITGVLRISFSKFTTQQDIDILCQKLAQYVPQLRQTIKGK